MIDIHRGDVCLVNLTSTVGSVQGGFRPVVVVQNETGNHYSPTVLVVPLTSKYKKPLPTHVYLPIGSGNLKVDSTALTEQVQTIDKNQIERVVGTLSSNHIEAIDNAIRISLAL